MVQNKFNTYNNETKEYLTVYKLDRNINQFELMFKGYEANNESLKKFADDIITWRNEVQRYLKNYLIILIIVFNYRMGIFIIELILVA